MGIYGNSISMNNTSIVEDVMNPMEFVMFCTESVHEVDLMIERVNITSITEASMIKNENIEKIKKVIIEKIKKIYNEFVKGAKVLVNKIKEKILNLYLNTSVKDALMSTSKSVVKWENLEKIITAGKWKGLRKAKDYVVGTLVDFKDSSYYSPEGPDMRELIIKDGEIEAILKCKSMDEALEIRENLKKRFDQLKYEAPYRETYNNYYMLNDMRYLGSEWDEYGQNQYLYYDKHGNGHEDNNYRYYYPTKEMFDRTCEFVWKGQSTIKKMKFERFNFIKDIEKENKDIFEYLNKAKTDNVEKTEADRINLLYYKTLLDYYNTKIYIEHYILNAVMKSLAFQYKQAIKTYLIMYRVITSSKTK